MYDLKFNLDILDFFWILLLLASLWWTLDWWWNNLILSSFLKLSLLFRVLRSFPKVKLFIQIPKNNNKIKNYWINSSSCLDFCMASIINLCFFEVGSSIVLEIRFQPWLVVCLFAGEYQRPGYPNKGDLRQLVFQILPWLYTWHIIRKFSKNIACSIL